MPMDTISHPKTGDKVFVVKQGTFKVKVPAVMKYTIVKANTEAEAKIFGTIDIEEAERVWLDTDESIVVVIEEPTYRTEAEQAAFEARVAARVARNRSAR